MRIIIVFSFEGQIIAFRKQEKQNYNTLTHATIYITYAYFRHFGGIFASILPISIGLPSLVGYSFVGVCLFAAAYVYVFVCVCVVCHAALLWIVSSVVCATVRMGLFRFLRSFMCVNACKFVSLCICVCLHVCTFVSRADRVKCMESRWTADRGTIHF